ncbi:hypothetical protein FQR65_LT11005 [Abscondita terminalis]|nr:hypothetical protein FQR65_LT11005 [Abscondita terminalis]
MAVQQRVNLKFIPYFLTKLRRYSTNNQLKNEIPKIRNIGILAHIDAGKTTTTERMLYYSGKITHMGEVHHGNTVTDYMAQERERGITIKSAAVTFNWKNHQFNLIDTPGHIDFTMEVEETLSVLDGAVVILDASAGVEAQTLTVWRQADRYNIPRLVYVNKMDRADADLKLCCGAIEKKLEKPALCLHVPIIENNKFVGIADVIALEKIIPSKNNLVKVLLTEKGDLKTWTAAKRARDLLIDRLTEFNDDFANIVINNDSLENVSAVDIIKVLRKLTIDQAVVPVLCGSSYKNVGVQPLMDSIILYLSSPHERNREYRYFKDSLCARAFKIIHDKQRGPLVFLRIYSGVFNQGQKMYNVTQNCNEQSGRLYIAYADEYQDVDKLHQGNIAVVSGLKKTTVGDLITQSSTAAQRAKQEMLAAKNENFVDKIFGIGTRIPEPVFFCSIEPPSLAYQNSLEQALTELQREDPSLSVTHDSDTGQTVLAGMGELHLEIIKDRILKEYKIEAELGPLQIAYREAPIDNISEETTNDLKVGNTKHTVSISLSLSPVVMDDDRQVIKLDKTQEAASNLANISPRHLKAIKQGVHVALAHGPKISSQVINVEIMLHRFEVSRGTSDSVISATVTQCLQKMLREVGTYVLEPIMILEIVASEDSLSTILSDLTKRRANIVNIAIRGSTKVVTCEVPLSELLGYSTTLRTITSGTASFTMEFHQYKISIIMNKRNCGNQLDDEIKVHVTELILTPLACSTIINEVIKYLLYQKSQIPYPYSWLKSVVNKKRTEKNMQTKFSNFQVERHYNVVSTAFNSLENLMSSINLLFKNDGNNINRVLIIFGSSVYTAKEVYTFKISNLASDHLEENHSYNNAKNQHKVIRSIVLSEEWVKAMTTSIPPTNMFVLIQKCAVKPDEEKTDFQLTSQYSMCSSVKNVSVTLSCNKTTRHNCCNNLLIFEDLNDREDKNLINHLDDCSGTGNSTSGNTDDFTEKMFWFQSKIIIKGFKEYFVNGVSATELW